MKVRCVQARLSDEQVSAFGPNFMANQTFEVTLGATYDVLGLIFTFEAPARGTGGYVVIAPAEDRVAITPLHLFEVLQARVPATWDLSVSSDEVEFLPPELSAPHFFDDLSERRPEAIAALRKARSDRGGRS
jgi:hypothetical protein